MKEITLLSDFGLHDPTVGAVKGALHTLVPSPRITDISHEVLPFQINQAAYLLGSVYPAFPAGTIHLAIVDVFYQPMAKMVLSYHAGQYFIAPDNGLLPLAFTTLPEKSWLCMEMTSMSTFAEWIEQAARVIATIHANSLDALGLQEHLPTVVPANVMADRPHEANCSVIYIDHYGNVITDMTHDRFNLLNTSGKFRISFMRVNDVSTIHNNYSDVAHGNSLCRFNRRGYMEICINQGNAANLFGFRIDGAYNEIKISFA